jgi:hypothetical protein
LAASALMRSEALDEILRISGVGLAGDCLHKTEHVLGAVTHLAHDEVLSFLVALALGDVADDLSGTDDAAFGIVYGRDGD